jgi:hypothetical protein
MKPAPDTKHQSTIVLFHEDGRDFSRIVPHPINEHEFMIRIGEIARSEYGEDAISTYHPESMAGNIMVADQLMATFVLADELVV